MEAPPSHRAEVLSDTLRRLVRRGARPHISRFLAKVRPEDVPVMLYGLIPAEQVEVFRIIAEDYPDTAGSVLSDLDPAERHALLEHLDLPEVLRVLRDAAVDDAVFIIESLPQAMQEQVQELMDRGELPQLRARLIYRDDTAGRIMDSEFFALSQETAVRDAIAALQEKGDVEMIFYLYVVDEDRHLMGVTSLRQLLLSPPGRTLREIMQRDVIKVDTETDQEAVAQLAARYDLLAIPVTDDRNRLVGIVTVDDIMDVFQDEAEEDFYKMAGTSDDELIYQDRPFKVAGIRLPWLLINLVGLTLTGVLLERFQVSFRQALFLLTFVPAVMGMGGNSGAQTSMITVRSLATGRLVLDFRRVRHFLWQQLKVGLLLGGATGVVVAGAALLLQGNPAYALVVGAALLLAIVTASLIGALIPLLFERMGIDPAVAAGPMVTTSCDVLGILIYFGLAGLLIRFLVG